MKPRQADYGRTDLVESRHTAIREYQDLHHTRGRQLRASFVDGAQRAQRREREDLAALQQWRDKCAKGKGLARPDLVGWALYEFACRANAAARVARVSGGDMGAILECR